MGLARLVLGAALILAASLAAASEPAQRIVSLGGSVTEIVFALNQQERLIARDTTSTHPEAALDLPDVGYVRALSPEGVLSTGPDLILAEADAGPPETLDILKEAQIRLVLIPDDPTGPAILEKITAVGAALGTQDAARRLAEDVAAQLKGAAARAAAIPEAERKRVLFVLSDQGGRILAGGSGTEAAAVIGMAGAVNAMQDFEGYKPVSDEAIIQAAPDVILLMIRGGEAILADETLLAMPAIAATPAGRDGAILRMGGQYLLGFGPRTAQAVGDLADALYGPSGS